MTATLVTLKKISILEKSGEEEFIDFRIFSNTKHVSK